MTDAPSHDRQARPHPASTSTRRVLVVDDEEPLAALVGTYLQRDGFEVAIRGDGTSAVSAARELDPDVLVLDLGLPGIDGLEVCRQVRTFSDAYILMLTARSDEVDKIVGLSVGADDYVTKPFSPRELVARVRVLLRRPRRPLHTGAPAPGGGAEPAFSAAPSSEQELRFGPLTIDIPAREVRIADQPVDLTRTEFDVLAALAERPRLAFSRRQLIDSVWGADWVGDEHLVDVHVAHLRRKLGDDASAPLFIRTVRGIGYRMGDGR